LIEIIKKKETRVPFHHIEADLASTRHRQMMISHVQALPFKLPSSMYPLAHLYERQLKKHKKINLKTCMLERYGTNTQQEIEQQEDFEQQESDGPSDSDESSEEEQQHEQIRQVSSPKSASTG
jgi:hypothetical protein